MLYIYVLGRTEMEGENRTVLSALRELANVEMIWS